MSVTIRPATKDDASALSHICLLTANAGTTAEHLHTIPELPGLVYAEPYVNLPSTFGFVLVDEPGQVVGYILGAANSRAFEAAADATWYPPLRAKYPLSAHLDATEADKRYMRLLERMYVLHDACVAFAPAHIHIDILSEHQRRGHGRRLIGAVVEYLRERGASGVWLGMDPKNQKARGFYERLGFRDIEGAHKFELHWRAFEPIIIQLFSTQDTIIVEDRQREGIEIDPESSIKARAAQRAEEPGEGNSS